MHLFDTNIGTGQFVLLIVALLIACGFEFVNGFHDTANAVATVIYTRSLRPWKAVLISGVLNLLGVYLGGIAVAMSIIKLLPVELLAASGSGAGLAMVLALLVAAIMWNLGTWWLGLPASSSHTLIGAIVGVGLANSLMPNHVFGSGVNWHKVREIGLSLLISPVFGLGAAALLLLLARNYLLKSPALHQPADPDKTPPGWIRAILIGTCSGVSFAHGSNDGQKGVGLIMLILIGLLPADYALNTSLAKAQIHDAVQVAERLETNTRDAFGGETGRLASTVDMAVPKTPAGAVLTDLGEIRAALNGKESIRDIPPDARFDVRSRIMRVDNELATLEKGTGAAALSPERLAAIQKDRKTLRASIDYAPGWVIGLIAFSLGIGTMIGWKRIVVTVGEKIGKTHLTYAQGASAEIVAMTTIGLSGSFGMPVSTTHVLSSGIAGTMIAQKSGLQGSTVRNIALAWVLTLPAATLLAGGLFLLFRALIPDAHAAATTPTVRFEQAGETAAVLPVSVKPLRLHGSNTFGAELAPSLAAGLLQHMGAKDVARTKNADGHAWVVSGTVPGSAQPVEIDIDAAGSGTAFDDLGAGRCDLGMASRMIRPEEAERLKQAGLGDLSAPSNENVIGLDGVAVVVNESNPLRTLAIDDIARIFDGETTNWPAAVDGASSPIEVYARDDRSGTYDTFKALVLGEHPLAAKAKRFTDSGELSSAVAANPQAIGFVGMSLVGRASAVAVSSGAGALFPTRFSVGSEDYPLTRRLYLYAPSPSTHPLAGPFVQFALSPEGQTLVAAAGFVNLSALADDSDSCADCPADYAGLTRGAKRLSLTFRFRSGQSDLDSRAAQDIGRLAAVLRMQRTPEFILLGFSDNQGTSDVKSHVSHERADRVAHRLEAYGLHASLVEGLGDERPVADNESPGGRDRNRRVEVWVRPQTALGAASKKETAH